jgi:hypothetical protein
MAPAGEPVDPSRCPLCGEANICAMQAERRTGEPQPPCWCTRATVAPGLLAGMPASAQGMACICAACVVRAGG